jgi:MFS family permease
MTQYWQLVHGYSPLGAGMRLVPYALTMMIAAPISARVVERFGTKRVVTAGLSIIALCLFTLSFIHASTPYPRVIAVFCVMAIGMGMTTAPATESVMGSLPREKAGVGSAVNDTTRQIGGALGVAIIGSVVTSLYASKVNDVAGRFDLSGEAVSRSSESLRNALDVSATIGDPATAVAFTNDVKDAFVASLSTGLRLGASIILIAALVVWRFLPARSHDFVETTVEENPEHAAADPTIPIAAGGG